MTIPLCKLVQQLALKVPRILCVFALFFGFFFLIFNSANAQIIGVEEPGPNPIIFPPPNVPDPFNPPNPNDRPLTTPPGDGGSGPGGSGTGTGVAEGGENASTEKPIIIGDGFLNSLYGFIVIFGGYLVGLAGGLLNWAVREFVIGFGDVYLTWGVGVAVENGWKIIRDVLNITFIFGIVYIGIRLIFDANDSSAKRSLGFLLAAALLINFSLFISKFVVDFSNSLAAVIYNTGLSNATEDLGASFINLLGLSTVVDNGSGTLSAGTTVPGGLAITFGTLIFMLMAMYALAAGAFLMFVRGIVLIFFMIFSPVMFLGWIFPQFKNFTSKYWSMFLSNAFMAPAYIFCLYLTFSIMGGFKYQISTTGGGSIGSLFSPQGYAEGINALVVFTLAIGMMLISITVAKRMGAFGGGLVVSVGDSMRKSGQSWVGRNTVGATANWLGKQNDRLEGSRGGRFVKGALTAASLGTLNERTRRNVINTGKNAKFGGSYSYSDDKKFTSELTTTRAQGALNSVVAKGLKSNASDIDKIALEREVAGANQSQLISLLSSYKPGTEEYGKIVQSMSHSQVNKLLEAKVDEFDDTAKGALAKTRGVQVTQRLKTTHNHIQEGIPKASAEDLVAMGYDIMLNNAFFLTAKQMDDLKTKLTPTEYANVEKARKDKLENTFADPQRSEAVFKKPKWDAQNNTVSYRDLKKDSEIAKLPADILIHINALPYMNPKVLDEILRNDLLDSDQRNKIRDNITKLHKQANPPANIGNLHSWLTTTPAGRSF